jgi:hypothetical protein
VVAECVSGRSNRSPPHGAEHTPGPGPPVSSRRSRIAGSSVVIPSTRPARTASPRRTGHQRARSRGPRAVRTNRMARQSADTPIVESATTFLRNSAGDCLEKAKHSNERAKLSRHHSFESAEWDGRTARRSRSGRGVSCRNRTEFDTTASNRQCRRTDRWATTSAPVERCRLDPPVLRHRGGVFDPRRVRLARAFPAPRAR